MAQENEKKKTDQRRTAVSVTVVLFHSVALKLLIMGAYFGVDLNVHRNWMAITHSLPIQLWYFDETVVPHFDQPPFYALFQYFLSHIAYYVDPESLDLSNIEYSSKEMVVFQRLSVIFTENLLLIGVLLYCNTWPVVTTTEIEWSRGKVLVVTALILFNPGLIMVDHIHFAFNGFSLGLLLISVAMIRQGSFKGDCCSAIVFFSLLMFKRVFVWVLPLYLLYLLRHSCFVPKQIAKTTINKVIDVDAGHGFQNTFSFSRFFLLLVVFSLIVSLGILPFLLLHEDPQAILQQMNSRLFGMENRKKTFSWAPNFWALYNGFDHVLVLLQRLSSSEEFLSFDADYINDKPGPFILPEVQPWTSCVLTILAMSPGFRHVWKKPNPPIFLPALIYCLMCYFMMGYNVDEKTILFIIICLSLTSCDSTMDARLYLLLSWIGHVSLLPLLITPDVKMLKPILLLLHCLASYICLDQFHIMARRARRIAAEPNGGGVFLSRRDRMYLYGLVMVYIFGEIIFELLPFMGDKCRIVRSSYPFLALEVSSAFCAIGMCHCWYLTFHQLTRKIRAVESYQWSPKHSFQASRFAEANEGKFSLNGKYSRFRD